MYYVKSVEGRRKLAKLHFVATIQKTKLSPENTRYHEYSSPDGGRAELFRSFTKLPGQNEPHELNVVLIPPKESDHEARGAVVHGIVFE